MQTTWALSALATASLAIGTVTARSEPVRVALAVPPPSVGAASVPGPVDASAARAAIEKANSEWLTAFRTGDAISLARIYAPDASLFPPSNDSLEGSDRIVEYFGAQRKAGMRDAHLTTLDVVCVGEVAYEVGTYGFRFEGNATAGSGDAGRYFAIWKSRPDGSWRYQVGIWSSNRDAKAVR